MERWKTQRQLTGSHTSATWYSRNKAPLREDLDRDKRVSEYDFRLYFRYKLRQSKEITKPLLGFTARVPAPRVQACILIIWHTRQAFSANRNSILAAICAGWNIRKRLCSGCEVARVGGSKGRDKTAIMGCCGYSWNYRIFCSQIIAEHFLKLMVWWVW